MCPVLEHATIDGQQLMQHPGLIRTLAHPQGMLVGALDDGDGVDLYIAQTLYGGGRPFSSGHVVPAAVQSLGSQGDPPGTGG